MMKSRVAVLSDRRFKAPVMMNTKASSAMIRPKSKPRLVIRVINSHICHRVVIVFAEWCIDAYMMTASHHTLRDFIFIYTGAGRQFLYARAALVFLLKSVDFLVYLVERTHLVQRQSHDAALFCYCLEDALANPPYSIGDEFEAAGLIEAFCKTLDRKSVV